MIGGEIQCVAIREYVPDGRLSGTPEEQAHMKARRIRLYAAKDGREKHWDGKFITGERALDWAANTLHPMLSAIVPATFSTVSLVPVPRSSAWQPGDHWCGLRVCERMAELGSWPVDLAVKRTESVPSKSGTASGRSWKTDLRTLTVAHLPTTSAIILVDDVLTSGQSMSAVALKLQESGYSGAFFGAVIGKTSSSIADGIRFKLTFGPEWGNAEPWVILSGPDDELF